MVRGAITGVAGGIVEGWLALDGGGRPRTALLAAEDGISLRAIADRYRADLFAAGLGHGHHGFRARVPLGAGRRLRLVDEASGLALSEILFPAADASDDRPLTVEALIAGPPRWTTAELVRHAENLPIAATLAALGPQVALERMTRFIFGEVPDVGSLRDLVQAVTDERIGPVDAFRMLLRTAERMAGGPKPLPGVYEGTYPFLRR